MSKSEHNRIYKKLYDTQASDKFSLLIGTQWFAYTDTYCSDWKINGKATRVHAVNENQMVLCDPNRLTVLGPRTWQRDNETIGLSHPVKGYIERNQTVLMFNYSSLKTDKFDIKFRFKFKKSAPISTPGLKDVLFDIFSGNILTDMTIIHLEKNSTAIRSVYLGSETDRMWFSHMCANKGLV